MKVARIALGLGAASSLSLANPIQKRQAAPTDADILNYALTLEHLENTFYRQGLAKYSQADFAAAGFDQAFYNNLKMVAGDEQVHVDFLTKGLAAAGAPSVKECTYAFPYTDVKSFLATASVLEGVGVSAYLGAAANIMKKDYLTAAGSILTVEARHSSYLRSNLKQSPFAQPFDNPLSINEVYTLAAQFIKSCPPENPKLPVKAFPTLTLAASDAKVVKGSTVTLKTADLTAKYPNCPIYGAFITVLGPVIVSATKVDGGYTVQVPDGVNGQSYVVLTAANATVTDDTVAAGPAIVEVMNY